MRVPWVPKAGRLAVTITAATLPVRMFGAAGVDAEALQHRLQRLLGEGDVVERVAGAVEADHEAVADQLVLAHALDVGEVLDPGPRQYRGRAPEPAHRLRARGRAQRHRRHTEQLAFHQAVAAGDAGTPRRQHPRPTIRTGNVAAVMVTANLPAF